MVDHEVASAEALLPALPLGSAAEALRRLAGLSRVAAAHHAAKGCAYSYGGTLIVATRSDDGLDGETTTVLQMDPTVLERDAEAAIAAIGARLPASRLLLRAALQPDRRPGALMDP